MGTRGFDFRGIQIAVATFAGGVAGLWFGEAVGRLSNNPSLILSIPCALLTAGIFGLFTYGHTLRPAARVEEPEEAIDTCGHRAKPVPVEVDVDGDGHKDIVAWLCEECGAKVSPPSPAGGSTVGLEPRPDLDILEGDALHVLLRARVEELGVLSATWEADNRNFILSDRQMDEYLRMVDECEQIKHLIDKRASGVATYCQSEVPIAADIGDMWINSDDGGAPYRWDGQSWSKVEQTSIISHQRAAPIRTLSRGDTP